MITLGSNWLCCGSGGDNTRKNQTLCRLLSLSNRGSEMMVLLLMSAIKIKIKF